MKRTITPVLRIRQIGEKVSYKVSASIALSVLESASPQAFRIRAEWPGVHRSEWKFMEAFVVTDSHDVTADRFCAWLDHELAVAKAKFAERTDR